MHDNRRTFRARGERKWPRYALLGLIAMGALVWAARRHRHAARSAAELRDLVDVASEDSFPASDPPPWTTGRDPDAPVKLPGR